MEYYLDDLAAQGILIRFQKNGERGGKEFLNGACGWVLRPPSSQLQANVTDLPKDFVPRCEYSNVFFSETEST